MASTWSPGTAAPDPVVQQKYEEERAKRVREDGTAQFEDAIESKHKFLADDPWADHAALNAAQPAITDGAHVKFLVLGTGYSGLLFAVRLVQAGFSASDIRFVDDAGGFGGTWYWNRYPGLMCDVESYIYMPLLEETDYMPKHKYAYGTELREHAERIAKQWNLTHNVLWRSRATTAEWNEDKKRWAVSIQEGRGPSQDARKLHIEAQFVFCASGLLNVPHIPKLPGFDTFEGKLFHTSRWNYDLTGGSPTDTTLSRLKDKVVGIIGTGATAVQVVPQLAKWAKHLYVFQRTPSAVDVRGQRATDEVEWKTKIATGLGWQQARSDNFNRFMTGSQRPDEENFVDDGWSRIASYKGLVGGRSPIGPIIPPERIPEHVVTLHALDLERSNRVRGRVDEIVKDHQTAEKLKAWYPAWCKRPTFHDDYLEAFNFSNVTLVDTDGKGCSALSKNGVVAADSGKEYPVDVLVLSTGYRAPGGGTGTPAFRAGLSVKGRNGRSMDEAWITDGPSTLHGIVSHGFPNFFFPGPSQAAASANHASVLDNLAKHSAYIVAEAFRRTKDTASLVVEPTKEATDAWTMQIMMRAGYFASISGCTPSYVTNEGERDRVMAQEDMIKAARGSIWSEGFLSFSELLKDWRAEGNLKGYDL